MPRLIPALMFTVLLVAGCGAATESATTDSAATAGPLMATVSVDEAAALRDAGALVIDVREPDEWAAGHIPGATLIPLGTLESRLNEIPGDQLIVVVCRSGNRSAQGRDVLRAAGFADVTSMDGGMTDWIAAGLPVETGS